MRLRELMTAVESRGFAVELGSVASRSHFDRAILRDFRVRDLMDHVRECDAAKETVGQRVIDLTGLETDTRYQHAKDVAIATYLRTLDILAAPIAVAVASHVVRLPNLWWARQLATRLLEPTHATDSPFSSRREQIGNTYAIEPDRKTQVSFMTVNYPRLAGTIRNLRIVVTNIHSSQSNWEGESDPMTYRVTCSATESGESR